MSVNITEIEIIVHFQKRAHNPFLIAAGFDQTDIPIPWLGRKNLQFIFGKPRVVLTQKTNMEIPASDRSSLQYSNAPSLLETVI